MLRHITEVLVLVVVLCVSATATVIEVPGHYSSIQAGIDASTDGDTVLVDSGIYVENINFNDHSIVLGSKFLTTRDTSYISSTIIDGASVGSVITVALNEDSTTAIIGLTIQSGNATEGGGVYFNAFGLTLSNLNIRNNTASADGGGIFLSPYFSSKNIDVIACTVSDNTSGARGGGVYSHLGQNCLLNVSHCLIENNTAVAAGGGIYSSTASSITNSSFVNNTVQIGGADDGGGGFCGESMIFSIDSSTFIGNLSMYGGAIAVRSIQSMVMSHSLISGNEGTHSSGIHMNATPTDSLVITNCTFSNNHSFGNLGVLNLQLKCTVRNSVFSHNTSDGTCGGISFSSSASVAYCNIFGNQPADYIGAIPAGLGEPIGENVNGDSCDAFQNIFLDPLFCDTAIDNYELAETSPCLGAGESGSDIGAFGIGCIAVDVEDEDHGSVFPYSFQLSQNYPNPFNPVTTIEYTLPRRSDIRIDVFNLLGQRVRTLISREKPAGKYSIAWDGTGSMGKAVSTGVYFYRFQAGDHAETKKMLLLK